MIKLHQQLENTLKIRINSNEEIIPAIKRLSELGKFDKPKEIATFAIILDRLGKLEDDALLEQSLKEDNTNTAIEDIAKLDPIEDDGVNLDVIGGTIGNPPENAVISDTEANQLLNDLSNPTTSENQTPPSASDDVSASPEQPISPSEPETPVETPTTDTTPTVSTFTPENITDPVSNPDPTNPS